MIRRQRSFATIRGKTIQFYSNFEGNSISEAFELYHATVPFLSLENGSPNVSVNFYNQHLTDWDYPTVDNPLIVPESAVYVNNLPDAQTPVIRWRVAGTLKYLGTYIAAADAVFTRFRILLVNADNSVADSLFISDLHVVEFAPGADRCRRPQLIRLIYPAP